MKTTPKQNRRFIPAAVLLVAAANPFPASAIGNKSNTGEHWVGTWACAPQSAESAEEFSSAQFANGVTLRQIVHISAGGKILRVRFSNLSGKETLTISSAHLATPAAPGEIRPGTEKKLTFGHRDCITIPVGALAYSDPIAFEIPPLSDLAVTIYLRIIPTELTVHAGARATSYFTASNVVSAAALPNAKSIDHWYFLSGIDVSSSRASSAIVALGDSITDGKNSTTNGNTRWPDVLASRLQSDLRRRTVSVLNEGIGGNRILRDGLGPNALARLDRDVLAQAGVRWLVLFEGVNDIGTCKELCDMDATINDIIFGYEQIVLRAHSHGIRVYGATITPFGGSFYATAVAERARQTLNNWIRTSGSFDAVLDFDRLTRDPNRPENLLPSFDSGDHLHPGDEGYRAIARSIDLGLFQENGTDE
jgi:lysophospholipase L1-like esterase